MTPAAGMEFGTPSGVPFHGDVPKPLSLGRGHHNLSLCLDWRGRLDMVPDRPRAAHIHFAAVSLSLDFDAEGSQCSLGPLIHTPPKGE